MPIEYLNQKFRFNTLTNCLLREWTDGSGRKYTVPAGRIDPWSNTFVSKAWKATLLPSPRNSEMVRFFKANELEEARAWIRVLARLYAPDGSFTD